MKPGSPEKIDNEYDAKASVQFLLCVNRWAVGVTQTRANIEQRLILHMNLSVCSAKVSTKSAQDQISGG